MQGLVCFFCVRNCPIVHTCQAGEAGDRNSDPPGDPPGDAQHNPKKNHGELGSEL
jgi:hypothetical protein